MVYAQRNLRRILRKRIKFLESFIVELLFSCILRSIAYVAIYYNILTFVHPLAEMYNTSNQQHFY